MVEDRLRVSFSGLSGAASQTKSQIGTRRFGPQQPSFHRTRAGRLRGRRTCQHRRSESRHTGQYESLSVAGQERRELRFLSLLLRTLALGIPPVTLDLRSYLVLTGSGARFGQTVGFVFNLLSSSVTARSSCGSLPWMTDLGSFSTGMSGSTP